MSKVNFVNEFNLFMRYARNNGLSLRERMLWIALFHIANDRAIYNEQTQEYDWPEGLFFVSHGELYSFCCLDKRSIETLRNSLKQRGLIDFKPGNKNKSNPAYKINYLSLHVGCKNVPNDVSSNVPNTSPNSVPNNAPNSVSNDVPSELAIIRKYKLNTGVGVNDENDTAATAAAANACAHTREEADGLCAVDATAAEDAAWQREIIQAARDCGLPLQPAHMRIIKELWDEYSCYWLIDAINRCARRPKQSWGCVEGILQSWRAQGRRDAADPYCEGMEAI